MLKTSLKMLTLKAIISILCLKQHLTISFDECSSENDINKILTCFENQESNLQAVQTESSEFTSTKEL